MADCKICKSAIFDEVWGEYKCMKRQRNVFPVELYKNCKDFEKDPKKKNTQD